VRWKGVSLPFRVFEKDPACEPCSRRREQAVEPRACAGEVAAGTPTRNEGQDQQ
jgi:hypothetical protein